MKPLLTKLPHKTDNTVKKNLTKEVDKLTASLHYADAIIRTIREPFIILDEELRVLTANRSFYKTFKVLKKKTQGKLIYELGNNQWDIPRLRELLENVLPTNNYFDNFEVEHTFPTIGHKVMLLNARKFFHDGEHILLAFTDISNRREIEGKKDNFISIASHELKTPITSIKAFIQILQRKLMTSTDKNTLYIIDKIAKQMDRLTNLIDDLLDVRKIQLGKVELKHEVLAIDDVVQDIVETFQYSSETHVVMRGGEARVNIVGDSERIGQVLTNLITNAIKYSPKANKVTVKVRTEKGNVIIGVQDFGIGITEEEQKRVFEPFYRVTGLSGETFPGLGLGLHISADIVKRHGGQIWIESVKGKGSTFFVSLPVK